jgi:hypothetical protein
MYDYPVSFGVMKRKFLEAKARLSV